MIRALFVVLFASLLHVRGEVFIGPSSEWRYLDAGTAPAEWKATEFSDSAWKSGKAPLGYGEKGLATTIETGSDAKKRPVTTWFRRSFDLAEAPAAESKVILAFRADDGAAVYLNGKQIARVNLPEDAKPETLAKEKLDGFHEQEQQRVELTGAALLKGRNLIAVEVHQCDEASSDMILDLSLRSLPATQSVRLAEAAKEVTMAYLKNHFIGPDKKVPDGYLDGGRRMVLGESGVAISTREILVIDRAHDAALRRHLEHAKSPEIMKLSTEERARAIARYVDQALSPQGARDAALEAVEMFTIEYANRPVMFGEMEEVCQGGVCRHRALLFKMMCDDAGLKTALVRGNYSRGFSSGGHAWNELTLDDGSLVIVDVMNPLPDFRFLSEKDRAAKPYVSVRNEPLYPRAHPSSK